MALLALGGVLVGPTAVLEFAGVFDPVGVELVLVAGGELVDPVVGLVADAVFDGVAVLDGTVVWEPGGKLDPEVSVDPGVVSDDEGVLPEEFPAVTPSAVGSSASALESTQPPNAEAANNDRAPKVPRARSRRRMAV